MAAILVLLAFAPPGAGAASPPAPHSNPRHAPRRAIFPVRGVTLGLFYPRDRQDFEASLDRIAALGATHVSIPIPLRQAGQIAVEILPEPDLTPPDSLLLLVTREARRRSLEVLYFPLVNLGDTRPGVWRGTIRPEDWSAWFASYRGRLLHYARLAGASGAGWLCVGAELVSSEGHRNEWEALIDSVRAVYPGRLLYSRNWDTPGALPFAGKLDLVGLNAYFELSARADPPLSELVRKWRRIRAALARRRQEGGGRPLLFTEVGYPSSERAAARPWDHDAPRTPRPELQARCFEAFFRAWRGAPGVMGGFVYLWSAHEGGAADPGYSIRGKPAERTIGEWYGDGR